MEAIGELSGVFIPLSTPFAQDESVDYESLRSNMEHYRHTGVRGYLALGSNGECKSLTEQEKLRVLGGVVEHKAAGQVVIAGAAYEAQRDAERFLQRAADIGASFGLLLSPSYFRKQMTEEVLYRYFATVADLSPIPILIYNAPGFSGGISLSPELVARLSSHPNIVGMKHSAPSGIEHFLGLAGDQFCVLAGSISFMFTAIMNGAVGGVVSLANSFPSLPVELFKCGTRRDESNGIPLQERCSQINRKISGAYGVPGVKAAMKMAGLKGGIPRRPLLPLTREQIAELRDCLIAEGLLE